MHYRRTDVAGATYFFTLNLAERHRTLLTEHIAILRTVMRGVKQRHPFHIDALVILPDHLHCILTLPEGDADYPLRWALIKAGFSRRIAKTERRNSSRVNKGERGVWQRRYWEHMIRDERDYARHVDYIHYNPVKHGYTSRATDWPYSSIHRYIVAGTLTRDWGAGVAKEDGQFGER
ncbi:MAG TPA: transposase [Acidiferrobacterales bacterium]|nr:transposase [Acidiferrobacterales bacterium]